MDSRINNGMCRCCASEGTFKDLASTYHWMGEEEIYAEMLKECLDIHLSSSEDGEEGGICEVCITQLRNASNFKKQVLHTERQFKKRLQERLFKTSIVKVEVPGPDEDALESDNDNNVSEDFSGTEYEVPIKEEIEEPKPKKRATKATTSRVKKLKSEHGETSTKRGHLHSGKVFSLLDPDPRFTKSIENSKDLNKLLCKMFPNSNSRAMCELQLQLYNLKVILRNSNASMIRDHTDVGYGCYFCEQRYPLPADLKQHTLDDHINPQLNFAKICLTEYRIKMDITGLKCKLCDLNINTIESLMDHLVTDHDEKIYTCLKNYIMPFEFDTDKLICSICNKEYGSFKTLLEHMNSHYRNFVCNICSAGFINKLKLSAHKVMHDRGIFTCGFCSKLFDNKLRMKQHVRRIHSVKQLHRCRICDETFKEFLDKKKHQIEKHGRPPREFKCKACDKVYAKKTSLDFHTRRDHLLERPFECQECNKTFSTKSVMKSHLLTHLQMKMVECEVCKKPYANFKTLKEHMKIHNNDKRFKCDHCEQAFIQKCSLKVHLKNKHGLTV